MAQSKKKLDTCQCKSMLRGGQMLGGSAAPESQMPADDGGGPGARKSAALLGGFSQYPWVHNADIAFSETIEILPQADAINNSVVSYQIPPSSSPGVFYSGLRRRNQHDAELVQRNGVYGRTHDVGTAF